MSVLGLMTAAIPAVQWARFHQRYLQRFLLEQLKDRDLEEEISIPTVKRSLWWWKDTENLNKGVFWISPFTSILTTNASSWGWGAHLSSGWAQGRLMSEEKLLLSSWKELTAILRALLAFQNTIQGHQVRSDNTTAVAYINKQGGTRNPRLMLVASRIFQWAESNLASISAIHLKGELNNTADFLSRQQVSNQEWSLHPEVFDYIAAYWGKPVVDLFANKENAKVPHFCSLYPGDQPLAVDTLQTPWTFSLAYAFPPLHLIPRVLAKFLAEETCLILVALFWPKRPWFTTLLRLTDQPPLRLPCGQDLLSQEPLSSASNHAEPLSVVTEEEILRSKGLTE